MSGLGLIYLVTSCFTNATHSYVGLWLVFYALCLTAERALLLSTLPPVRELSPRGCPALLPSLIPMFTSLLHQGKVCWSVGSLFVHKLS